MIRKTNYLFLLFLLAACGTSVDGRDRSSSSSEPTPIPTAVAAARPTYEVSRGDVIYEMALRGRIAPVVQQPLTFTQDGIVNQVYVQRDDLVKTGDPIADLDTSDLQGELILAQSALDIAQFQLATSQQEIDLARKRAQMRRDLAQVDLDFAITQAAESPTTEQQYQIDRLTILLNLAQLDVDELETAVDPELAADVDKAALRVAAIENQLTQAVLTAPFDGEISAFTISEGYAVMAGEAVGTIADPSQIEGTASFSENQLGQLAEDMAVQIIASSHPSDILPGTIRHLPDTYGSGGNPLVHIQFDDMEAALALFEPGEGIAANILITQRDDVLWLPPAAIRDFNGRKFVVVQEAEAQQRLDVTLGIAGKGRVEIVEGLEPGQIVVGQ